MKCERCVTDTTKCIHCRDNPIYAHIPKASYFSLYKPVCHLGYRYCIHDPGYIKATYPDWYEELYGDVTPEEAINDPKNGCSRCTKENCYYDDEDK